MKKIASALAFGLAMLATLPAIAHAQLEKADPAAGSMPAAPVTHIDLRYSEALEPAFSKATLTGEDGKLIACNSLVDTQDAKHLVLKPETPLIGGTYKVEWHVISIDTHKTQGSFQFKVVP